MLCLWPSPCASSCCAWHQVAAAVALRQRRCSHGKPRNALQPARLQAMPQRASLGGTWLRRQGEPASCVHRRQWRQAAERGEPQAAVAVDSCHEAAAQPTPQHWSFQGPLMRACFGGGRSSVGLQVKSPVPSSPATEPVQGRGGFCSWRTVLQDLPKCAAFVCRQNPQAYN